MSKSKAPSHHDHLAEASEWVRRFTPQAKEGLTALDLASGGGRHVKLLLKRGYQVTALDRVTSALVPAPALRIIESDLEDGSPFCLEGETFDLVLVTNYLHRPLWGSLIAAVKPGGLLIYETFAQGNEAFGKPSNPDFLLEAGELLKVVEGQFRVLAYEDLIVETPKQAAVQRIVARREGSRGA